MVSVIPVASDDPWTLHGPAHVCVACLPIFVNGYLADVPPVIAYADVMRMLESGELVEEE